MSSFQHSFYYDASLSYFSGEHLPYGVLALMVLFVFVLAPTGFLLLYPFKFFQQILSRLHLDRPGIAAVTDAFFVSFRNGSPRDGIDGRFFVGILQVFRLFLVVLYSVPVGIESDYSSRGINFISEFAVCLAMAGLILLIRPYRYNWTNVTDFFIFLHLSIAALVSLFANSFINADIKSSVFYWVIIVLLYLPAFGLLWFEIYQISIKVLKCYQSHQSIHTTNNDEDGKEDEQVLLLHQDDDYNQVLADHLLNPEDYEEDDSAAQVPQPPPANGNPHVRVTMCGVCDVSWVLTIDSFTSHLLLILIFEL